MGCSFFGSRSSYEVREVEVQKDPNPNPSKYTIVDTYGDPIKGKHIAVLLKYEGCTNYEGLKVIVFARKVWETLLKNKKVDPHFCEDKRYCPIARFAPDGQGWALAKNLVMYLG